MSTSTRVITIYSTKGGMKEITTDVTTYGELKPLMKDAGYDLKNLAATCGVTRNSLERDDAQLQEGDYTIFLRPVKTKSGAFTKLGKVALKAVALEGRKAVNAIVKAYAIEYGQGFKDHMNSTGNWTRVKTPEVIDLIASFKPSKKKAAAPKVVTKTVNKKTTPKTKSARNIAAVVETVVVSAEEANVQALKTACNTLAEAGLNHHLVGEINDFITSMTPNTEAEDAAIAAEEAETKRLADKEAKLKAQFSDMM